jgi:tetrahydromethanopterin S-methyltransferase subunit G
MTVANVIAALVPLLGAAVAVGISLQRLTHMAAELAKLQSQVDTLKEALAESRQRMGRRLGRIEGWINGAVALQEGRPAPLQSSRHDTRGIPLTLPTSEDSDESSKEGGGGG